MSIGCLSKLGSMEIAFRSGGRSEQVDGFSSNQRTSFLLEWACARWVRCNTDWVETACQRRTRTHVADTLRTFGLSVGGHAKRPFRKRSIQSTGAERRRESPRICTQSPRYRYVSVRQHGRWTTRRTNSGAFHRKVVKPWATRSPSQRKQQEIRRTVDRAVDLEAIAESIRSRPNKHVDALRVTQESGTVNSNPEMDEIRKQLNGMKVAMNSLAEMMSQIISAMVPGSLTDVQRQRKQFRCYACGMKGHSGKDCQQRGNTLN